MSLLAWLRPPSVNVLDPYGISAALAERKAARPARRAAAKRAAEKRA